MALPDTILNAKDLHVGSVLLATFSFQDGAVLRVSTHPFNTTEGGNQYSGQDYLARIDAQDIDAIQARSQQGIDRISEVTLHLYNSDQLLYITYERAFGRGFKGARLNLVLVLIDIDPTTGNYIFSTDSLIKFVGTVDNIQMRNAGQMLEVHATTSHNLARIDLPPVHVQPRCVNEFAATASQRLEGATRMDSWFWQCGYSPDIGNGHLDPEEGGEAARGNTGSANMPDPANPNRMLTDGDGIFISCNKTKADCIARGMYYRDSEGRKTGRFTGAQWAPPLREFRSKSYSQGRNITVFQSLNESIYRGSYPLVYGTQWLKSPIIENILGDGNSTRCEVTVGLGDVGLDGIQMVLVNGVIIPRNGEDKHIGGFVIHTDPLFRWNFSGDPLGTHTGKRSGSPTNDAGYNNQNGIPQGDPHGSLACLEVVVYVDLAESNSPPNIRVLRQGQRVKVPNTTSPEDQVFWPYIRSNLSADVLLDLLIWSNYQYSELNLQSFINESSYCGAIITYIDQSGSSKSHARFMSEFALEDRRKANEVIQSVLRGFNAQLIPNSSTGLKLLIRKTLAEQQGAQVPGSNYNTAVKSMLANGNTASGYVAYLIDESIILQDGNGIPNLSGPYTLPSAQTPNRIGFQFQDADNGYSDDSVTISDAEDVARAGGYQLGGQVIEAGYPILGPNTFDQGIRVLNVVLAESLRGNPAQDTRGTYLFDLETTVRMGHVEVGQIVLLRFQSSLQLQPLIQLESPPGTPITGILCRVESIAPTTDYRRIHLTLRWHEDIWYTDAYGQHAARPASDPGKDNRLPFPWKPFGEQPCIGNSMYPNTEWNFKVSQLYSTAADGTGIAKVAVAGCIPVNLLSKAVKPPIMKTQAESNSTGGSIPGNSEWYIRICAYDSDGMLSNLSEVSKVSIPPGSDTNTITTPPLFWDTGTVGYYLFIGLDDSTMCFQGTSPGSPSTITVTDLDLRTWGPPDQLFSHFLVRVKRVIHGGVWGAQCTGVTSTTVTFAGASFTTDQWSGYDISKYGFASPTDSNPLDIVDLRVSSNTEDTITIGANGAGVSPPDLTSLISVGDVLVMRTLPDIFTSDTIGDSNFVNYYAPTGLEVDKEKGNIVRIVAGRGRGQKRVIVGNTATVLTVNGDWDTIPDGTSRFIVEEPTWSDQLSQDVVNNAPVPSPVPVVALLDLTNYERQPLIIQAFTADAGGGTSVDALSPIRELYLWGASGNITGVDFDGVKVTY